MVILSLNDALKLLQSPNEMGSSSGVSSNQERITAALAVVSSAARDGCFTEINEQEAIEELDRVLKWELLGSDEDHFDWNGVAWHEIRRAALRCTVGKASDGCA